MSLLNKIDLSKVSKVEAQQDTLFTQFPVYVVCIMLGFLNGALGVAFAMGFAIIVELYFSVSFVSGIVPLALIAVASGLGISWLSSRLSSRLFQTLYTIKEMQVMLVASVLTSLLQVFIYMQG